MSQTYRHAMPFGAELLGSDGVRFRLFAPSAREVALALGADEATVYLPMARKDDGFFECVADGANAGTRYAFVVDGLRVPDPASRYQPRGVHGPSEVVDPAAFVWPESGWRGLPWNEHVFYELHVGTFTPEGTFAAARERLAALAELGVTAIELMPVAEVPGTRNWGYDGVLPYAPTRNYGTPNDLKAFVAAAHALGLAVYLDVVYNHFGPEGNYLHAYAPEFWTDRFHTPWGAAIDVVEQPAVRAFFIENALYWLGEYRFDGLRLDAVHAIYDGAERAFLRELAATVRAHADRPVWLVLENDANESALLERDFRAQWDDDAHHAAHVLATGKHDGYYGDYAAGSAALLARTLTSGFGFQGEPSAFRGGIPRGSPSAHLPLESFVTFTQNHDQVGNRPFGDRLAVLAPDAPLRAVVATILLAPPIPLIFMGEEWAASTPFLFFCDFEPDLARAVTAGRRSEFGGFAEFSDPVARERIPDPNARATFAQSTLRWEERHREPHASWLRFYRRLLAIRRREIAPRSTRTTGGDARYDVVGERGVRAFWTLDDGASLTLEANFGDVALAGFDDRPRGRVLFATQDEWNGCTPPWSVRWTLA